MTAGWGELAAFGTACGWALSSYVHGMVGYKVGAAGVTLLRLPFQMTVLGAACLLTGVDTSVDGRALLLLFLSGLTGVSIADMMLYKGMTIIGPQLGVLLISLSSVFTALFGWLFLGETLPLQAVAGIGVTLSGIAAVVSDRGGSTLLPGQDIPTPKALALGVLLVAGAAMFLAISFIFWKSAMQEGAAPLWATFIRLVFSALLLWGLGMLPGWSAHALKSLRTQPVVFRMLLSASLFSAGGMWAAGLAMDMAPAGVAATIIGLQPVLVTVAGAAWNRRRPSTRVLLGTAVAFAGTALVCLR